MLRAVNTRQEKGFGGCIRGSDIVNQYVLEDLFDGAK